MLICIIYSPRALNYHSFPIPFLFNFSTLIHIIDRIGLLFEQTLMRLSLFKMVQILGHLLLVTHFIRNKSLWTIYLQDNDVHPIMSGLDSSFCAPKNGKNDQCSADHTFLLI